MRRHRHGHGQNARSLEVTPLPPARTPHICEKGTTLMESALTGTAALVTGASSGIGAACSPSPAPPFPTCCRRPEQGPRRVADIVNISSIAGCVAWNGCGVYNLTKFGVNGFTESLRQEVTRRHVRVSVVEPGGVATELGSHNTPEVRNEMIDPFYQQTEVLTPRTSPTALPTWSPAPATPPSASCGSCPPNSSDRIRRPPTSCAPRKTNGSTASFDEQRRLRLTHAIGSPPRPARPVRAPAKSLTA